MNAWYTRLYSLPDNLYLDGSPLMITAWALLKDNRHETVIAQLKLRNLYHSPLTACKVSVRVFDPSGKELEGVKAFSYLDLRASYGSEFGSRTPIDLPDNTTRRISVCVIQAVFEDGTVWQHPAAEWTPPELRRQPISEKFMDTELTYQYDIEVGGNCQFVPETAGSLFMCTCGALNLAGEKRCWSCERDVDTVKADLDTAFLTSKKEERLTREAAERVEWERIAEEKRKEAEEARLAAAAAKKRKKRITIIYQHRCLNRRLSNSDRRHYEIRCNTGKPI